MGEAMIFVVDSDEAVGQCDDEDMRKLEALAANKNDETAAIHSIGFLQFYLNLFETYWVKNLITSFMKLCTVVATTDWAKQYVCNISNLFQMI